jgi:hypothetical protein
MTYKERRIAEFREKLGGGAYAANNNFYESFLSETIEECRGVDEKIIKEAITQALGEASVEFMSQECKGTEIVMPSDRLKEIVERYTKEVEAKFGKEDK